MDPELPILDAPDDARLELADVAMISLLMDARSGAKPSRIRGQSARGSVPAKRSKLRRCACGKCRTCLDNARWESVFQRKFADPNYYSLHPPRHQSSLSEF